MDTALWVRSDIQERQSCSPVYPRRSWGSFLLCGVGCGSQASTCCSSCRIFSFRFFVSWLDVSIKGSNFSYRSTFCRKLEAWTPWETSVGSSSSSWGPACLAVPNSWPLYFPVACLLASVLAWPRLQLCVHLEGSRYIL